MCIYPLPLINLNVYEFMFMTQKIFIGFKKLEHEYFHKKI